nr:butyrophilin subfamily 2 member A1-like [Drosophila suzukii]
MGSLLLVILAIGLFPTGALSIPEYDMADLKLVYLRRNMDKMKPTILECDYDVEDNPPYLVVKWFKDDEVVFQWIQGYHPFTNPNFKNSIDTSYVSSEDPNKKHSALALINPTIRTTGKYKCEVQTASNIFFRYHRIQVIDLSNYSLDLFHNKIPNGTQLECVLNNMYPRPILRILSKNGDVIKEESNVLENEDGSFNATAVVDVNKTRTRSYSFQVFFQQEIQKVYSLTFNQN